MRYRKKPVVVEALQWNRDNVLDILAFCPGVNIAAANMGLIRVETNRGAMGMYPGDYIIKDANGNFQVYSEVDFQNQYDRRDND